jgi:elongation factor P hydroxylase
MVALCLPSFIVFDCEEIKSVFEQAFGQSHNIRLVGGAAEPLYLPAGPGQPHNRLIYSHDYPASALHEIAHWCLASVEQLALKDWGHWYTPDGRTAEQQRQFQRAEARVQAIEWFLSLAAGRPFRESSDNLSGEAIDAGEFKDQIHAYALRFCAQGLPERAGQLFSAFGKARGKNLVLSAALFQREALDTF